MSFNLKERGRALLALAICGAGKPFEIRDETFRANGPNVIVMDHNPLNREIPMPKIPTEVRNTNSGEWDGCCATNSTYEYSNGAKHIKGGPQPFYAGIVNKRRKRK